MDALPDAADAKAVGSESLFAEEGVVASALIGVEETLGLDLATAVDS